MFYIRIFIRKLYLPVILGVFIACVLLQAYQNAWAENKTLIGKCSWYSKNDPTDPFEHKFNADGSRFDENDFTCAMRSRDFGKYYKITNLNNSRSVIVRHCDYGPALTYKGRKLNRVMDLSKSAFQAIADLDIGVIQVTVEETGGK